MMKMTSPAYTDTTRLLLFSLLRTSFLYDMKHPVTTFFPSNMSSTLNGPLVYAVYQVIDILQFSRHITRPTLLNTGIHIRHQTQKIARMRGFFHITHTFHAAWLLWAESKSQSRSTRRLRTCASLPGVLGQKRQRQVECCKSDPDMTTWTKSNWNPRVYPCGAPYRMLRKVVHSKTQG